MQAVQAGLPDGGGSVSWGVAQVVFPGITHHCPHIGHMPSRIHDDELFGVIPCPGRVTEIPVAGFCADLCYEFVQAGGKFVVTASQASILDDIAGRYCRGPRQARQQESCYRPKML
jgi:hypothetical protein